MIRRLLAALALVCACASLAQACDDDRYPWLSCYGAAVSAPAAARAGAGASVSLSARRAAYGALVERAAGRAGVPLRLAHAVVRFESGYNPRMRGRAGEWGIGQILCRTARSVGFAGPCRRLADPAVNLTYAMAYLRRALAKGGRGCAGVSLYNRGIGARPRCTPYGRRVLALAGD